MHMADPNYHFPDELEALDYLMFRGETDPRTRSGTMGIITLEGTPSLASIQHDYDRISRNFVRLRQHVVTPAIPVVSPRWVIDPDFDLNYHVRTVALPAPGSMRNLLDVACTLANQPFDLSRPLWEATLVTGLGETQSDSAVLFKMHHSVMDGMGAMALLGEFFDSEENAPARPMPPKPIPEELNGVELARRGLLTMASKALPRAGRLFTKGLDLGLETVQNPMAAVNELQEQLESAKRVLGELPVSPSPVLRRRGLGRRIDAFSFPLADLRAAAKSNGCSVNDAYLAAVCDALRRYHEAMGEPVDAVPMAIPVNLRRDDDPSAGNRFAGARLVAPIAISDPRDAMKVIRERVLSVTAEPAINLLSLIAPALNLMPQPILESFNELVAGSDVQASNVPGYPGPLWLNGHRVTGYYPIGPVPGVGMMIAMLSLMGQCHIGVHLDTAAVSDPELFGRCLRDGFAHVINSVSNDAEPDAKSVRKSRPTSKGKKTAKQAAKPSTKPKSRGPKSTTRTAVASAVASKKVASAAAPKKKAAKTTRSTT